jgi:hypothetical protein
MDADKDGRLTMEPANRTPLLPGPRIPLKGSGNCIPVFLAPPPGFFGVGAEFVRGETASKHRSPSPILAKTAKSAKSGMTATIGAAPDRAHQSMEGSWPRCISSVVGRRSSSLETGLLPVDA